MADVADGGRRRWRRGHEPVGVDGADLGPGSFAAGEICGGESVQSTATFSAAQMARIWLSASRPSRPTNTATETLSTESRFTAERRGIGSASGSRTTSLASPRMVVVDGATSVRRSRGMAASISGDADRVLAALAEPRWPWTTRYLVTCVIFLAESAGRRPN